MGRDDVFDLVGMIVNSSEPEDRNPFDEFLKYVQLLYDGDAPCHEKSIHKTIILAFPCYQQLTEKDKDNFNTCLLNITQYLQTLGYQNNILTDQELALADGYEHLTEKYIPKGVLQGEITIAQANKARSLQWMAEVYSRYYRFDTKTPKIIPVRIALLDRYGRSIHDPIPLDEELKPIKKWDHGEEFPFPRK